jgi:Zn-dependent protease with chaperone function
VPATLCVAIALTGCATPRTQAPSVDSVAAAAEARKQQELVLESFLDTQSRLERVGVPILQAALPFCAEKRRYTTGAWFWIREAFPEDLRTVATTRFGAMKFVQVGIVREGSPAHAAGLEPGDVPVKVDDWTVPLGATDAYREFIDHLDNVLSQPHLSRITFTVRRREQLVEVTVVPVEICDYRLVVQRSDAKNAYADGERVVVFQGLMDFLDTDEELATVVSHEVAHNVMGHVEAKQVNAIVGGLFGLVLDVAAAAVGVNTQGQFSKLGSNVGARTYSVEFEQEADYVGMYLMANAGYDERQAPNVWRKMAIQNPKAIAHRSSHPTTPERFLALEKTVGQIELKRQTGVPLVPEFKPRTAAPPPASGDNAGN